MPLLFPLFAWRGLAYILQQHSSLISQQTVLVLCPFQAACASVGKLSTLLLLLLLHAAYQKCNTNCFNVRGSRCSPNCNNNEFALMMRQALSHSLSLSHHSLSHFNLENILNSASSIKQMKKNPKTLQTFLWNFLWKLKIPQSCFPHAEQFPIFQSISFGGRKWIYHRIWGSAWAWPIHLHLQLQLNSLLRFLVMSTGILTAHQIADCHLIAAAIAWNRY